MRFPGHGDPLGGWLGVLFLRVFSCGVVVTLLIIRYRTGVTTPTRHTPTLGSEGGSGTMRFPGPGDPRAGWLGVLFLRVFSCSVVVTLLIIRYRTGVTTLSRLGVVGHRRSRKCPTSFSRATVQISGSVYLGTRTPRSEPWPYGCVRNPLFPTTPDC